MRGKTGKVGIFNWCKNSKDGSYYTKEGHGSWPHFMIIQRKTASGVRWLVKYNINSAANKPPIGAYMPWTPKEADVPDFDKVSGTFGTLGGAQAWLGRG